MSYSASFFQKRIVLSDRLTVSRCENPACTASKLGWKLIELFESSSLLSFKVLEEKLNKLLLRQRVADCKMCSFPSSSTYCVLMLWSKLIPRARGASASWVHPESKSFFSIWFILLPLLLQLTLPTDATIALKAASYCNSARNDYRACRRRRKGMLSTTIVIQNMPFPSQAPKCRVYC